MISIKSLIKKYFYKSDAYPKNVIVLSDEKYYKTKDLLQDIEDDEEIVLTVDNEQDTNIVDCVVFSTKKIYYCSDDSIKAVQYEEISGIELPKEKLKEGVEDITTDRWSNVNDKAKLCLKNGEFIDIRIICGGIYALATLLQNSVLRKHIEKET